MWLYHRVTSPNDADGMANSVDPDHTAPLGAVWSGSALFAQTYLSENLGSLGYYTSLLYILVWWSSSMNYCILIIIIWATSRENLSSEVSDQLQVGHKPVCAATETS